MGVNPVIPPVFDVIWIVAVLLVTLLTIAALIVLALAWQRQPIVHTVAWLVLVLAVPVLGSIGWLIYAPTALRNRRRTITV